MAAKLKVRTYLTIMNLKIGFQVSEQLTVEPIVEIKKEQLNQVAMIDLTVDRNNDREKVDSATVTSSSRSTLISREKPPPKYTAESTTQGKY